MTPEDGQAWVTIRVELLGSVAEQLGKARVTLVVPSPLPQALAEICQQVSGLNAALQGSNAAIMVNGVNLQRLQGQTPKLADGDTVAFVPFVAGG